MYKPVFSTVVKGSILFALLFGCKKHNDPKPVSVPTYTSGIGGVRNWHGHHHYTASGPNFPTAINEDRNLSDTSFAITVVNDSTVICMGTSYGYRSSDSAKQIHFFGLAEFYYIYGSGRGAGIAYYYNRDSIVYFKDEDVHATTDSWLLDNKYYTY